MDMRVHYFGEMVHNRKVVLLDKDMEMVNIEVVVLVSNWVGIGVVLYMVQMAHKVVGMVVEG